MPRLALGSRAARFFNAAGYAYMPETKESLMVRLAFALLIVLAAAPALATEAGWALLRNGGQVVLLANAHAPGTGDPANFEIGNCSTQRNLSARGRQQARGIGALFYARAAPVAQVLSSRYCRCLQTAEMAFDADIVEPFAALDAPGEDPDRNAERMQEARTRIMDYSGAGNLVMVTHPENITALTGAAAREGEAIIVSRSQEELGLAARITFN